MSSIASVVPILKVTDIEAAKTFYTQRLGFTIDWHYQATETGPHYVSVSREGHRLHLSTFFGDSKIGVAVYFYVEDIEALNRELRETGLEHPAIEGPVDQTWQMREVYVKDPDGNSLRFGAPVKSIAPPPAR